MRARHAVAALLALFFGLDELAAVVAAQSELYQRWRALRVDGPAFFHPGYPTNIPLCFRAAKPVYMYGVELLVALLGFFVRRG